MKTRGARHKAVAHRGGALECNMKDGGGCWLVEEPNAGVEVPQRSRPLYKYSHHAVTNRFMGGV